MILEEMTAEIHSRLAEFDKQINDKSMLYFSADIPVEIIASFGYHPIRISSDIQFSSNKKGTKAILQPYICSKSSQMLRFLINHEVPHAIFSENHCDSLQNTYDVLHMHNSLQASSNYFRFLLPVKRGGNTELRYYIKEIKRMISWLEEISGSTFDQNLLVENINYYNKKRELLSKLSELVSQGKISNSSYFSLKNGSDILPVRDANSTLEKALEASSHNLATPKHIKIIFSGGMFDNFRLFEQIPELDVAVVANDLTFGSRSEFLEIEMDGDPIEQLARAYIIDRIPDSVHYYPNKHFEYLENLIEQHKANAVIFIYYSFCDPDAFETRNLSRQLETKELPVLTLVTDPELSNIQQLTTRVEAFLEKLGDL